jgi:GNAT superfamily N-acetyltransferase
MGQHLLSTEADKLGNEIQIMKTDTLGMSPIYSFFLRQMADLIDAGFCFPVTTWDDNKCGAVYAIQDNKVLGHIVYEHRPHNNMLWITLSAVDSSCRGRGIYTILHKHFEAVAREMGCWAISSHVHKDNLVRQASCESAGMKPIFYFMGKKL